jgi:hypothetical protein
MTYQPHILSKSTFMYGCQCPKRLYLHKFNPELKDELDEQQQFIYTTGTNVGELAQQRFPGGENAEPPTPYEYHLSVAKTQELINKGVKVIYEAAFNFEGVMCAMDILVNKDNKWHAYEVKSTNSAKPQHTIDAALQYFVITKAGITLEDISILHFNKEYVRRGELNIEELFAATSIKEEVLDKQMMIESKVNELKGMLAAKTEPIIEPGEHCSKPYPCDFMGHCWKDVVEEEVDYGKESMDQLELQKFVSELEYPLYFFDFETVGYGVPEYNESRPYQAVPVQFSLHILDSPDGELKHEEFLGDGINDPRKELINQLIKHIGTKGSVIVWYKPFENSKLGDLARDFPEYAEEIGSIQSRLVDLMIPFKAGHYHHPGFEGSASLKMVLPILVPELNYGDLEIQDGGSASLTYAQLKDQDAETQTKQREGLLAYCEMDTLAMVRIFERVVRNI